MVTVMINKFVRVRVRNFEKPPYGIDRVKQGYYLLKCPVGDRRLDVVTSNGLSQCCEEVGGS